MILRLSICLLMLTTVVVEMASNGVKESACASMLPAHYADEQVKEPPYELQVSSTSYTPASNITVLLKSNDISGFKGFLCQARGDLNQYRTYGKLTPSGNVPMTNNCEDEASLTHTNASRKSSITFTWTPPEQNIGNIIIICTVVQQFDTFWTNITSPVISYSAVSSTSSSTFSTTTSNVTTTTSTKTQTINSTLTTPEVLSNTTTNMPKLTTVGTSSGNVLCYVHLNIFVYAYYIMKNVFV